MTNPPPEPSGKGFTQGAAFEAQGRALELYRHYEAWNRRHGQKSNGSRSEQTPLPPAGA